MKENRFKVFNKDQVNVGGDIEAPVYVRAARTQIFFLDGDGDSQLVMEPYRTVISRMNKARTHFEVTLPGKKNKMAILVDMVECVLELK